MTESVWLQDDVTLPSGCLTIALKNDPCRPAHSRASALVLSTTMSTITRAISHRNPWRDLPDRNAMKSGRERGGSDLHLHGDLELYPANRGSSMPATPAFKQNKSPESGYLRLSSSLKPKRAEVM